MRRAFAYFRNDRIYVNPMSKTTMGGWLGTAPFVNVAPGDSERLGAALRDCLESSRVGVPHPQQHEWSLVGEERYQSAGVKNWAEFIVGTQAVSVDQTDDAIVITPHRRRDKGFVPLNDEKQNFAINVDENSLGSAVLHLFRIEH